MYNKPYPLNYLHIHLLSTVHYNSTIHFRETQYWSCFGWARIALVGADGQSFAWIDQPHHLLHLLASLGLFEMNCALPRKWTRPATGGGDKNLQSSWWRGTLRRLALKTTAALISPPWSREVITAHACMTSEQVGFKSNTKQIAGDWFCTGLAHLGDANSKLLRSSQFCLVTYLICSVA